MKRYRVILNSSVYSKLEDILSFISIESPKVALDVIDGIEKQILSLSSMPERFPLVPEMMNKTYQVRHCFYKKSFRIIYTVYKNSVRILDIRHGARDCLSAGDMELL